MLRRAMVAHMSKAETKRFNLWLPVELWQQLEASILRKQKLSRRDHPDVEVKITPQTEIRRALRHYLTNGGK